MLKVSETKAAVDALEKEVGMCLRGYVAGTSVIPNHLQIDVQNLAGYLTETLGLTSTGIRHTDTVTTDRQTDRQSKHFVELFYRPQRLCTFCTGMVA